MLKGISPLLSPELLKTLCEMGHGDEIVLADAHFPAHTMGRRVLRADGCSIAPLLDAILELFELDRGANPISMMKPQDAADLDPLVEEDYLQSIRRHAPGVTSADRLDREHFYQRAQAAFAVLITGELRPYGNILLRKGVTPRQNAT